MKVVYNACFGGFDLSDKALKLYNERADVPAEHSWHIRRDDPVLVSVIEELGIEADGNYASLEVIDIPDGYDYVVDEYDGLEHTELVIREEVLREKIREGNEDEIVKYVMMVYEWHEIYDDYIVDLGDEEDD